MDRKILNVLLIGLLFLLASCEKDADIPVPHEDPKLVVYSYISPTDTVISVSVTSSNSVFGNSNDELFDYIENATVTITTGGNTYQLTYDPVYYRYVIDAGIPGVNPGQTYTLNVSAPGFETVSAGTVIPHQRDWDFKVTFHSKTPPNTQFGLPAQYRFDVSWKHFDANDHYRLAQHFYRVDTTMWMGQDTIVEEHNNNFYNKDQGSSGIITDLTETSTAIYEEDAHFPHGFYYDLIVSTYDYYKFHQSVENHTQGDPFAEPAQVYSNMQNGYGIFAGYIKVSRRIDF